MSAVKDLYNSIITKLGAVSGAGTTGKWNSQVLNQIGDNREMAIKYPAMFLEINVEWQQANLATQKHTDNRINQQKGTATVVIHILTSSVDYTSDSFGAAMDLAKLVWDDLNGYKPDNCSSLQRVNSIDDTDHDVIRDWQEVYVCQVTECPNADNLTDAAPATIVIDMDYA